MHMLTMTKKLLALTLAATFSASLAGCPPKKEEHKPGDGHDHEKEEKEKKK